MEITAELVKTLRDRTSCGFMDCKKALAETGGDLEQAVAYLRQKGLAVATKRGGRATSEGVVCAQLGAGGQSGVLVEVNCESDFVAKTPAFQEFAAQLAARLAERAPAEVEQLLAQPWDGPDGPTVQDHLNEIIAQTGENIRVRHFVRYAEGTLVAAYIHHGGRIGVLLEMSGAPVTPEAAAVAKDLAMQVAAANPLAVNREEVDSELVAKESAILKAQAQESGKPEKIIERMVIGRLDKYFKEVCLLEQPFVKNPDITVAQYLLELSKQTGAPTMQVRRFCRYQIGIA